MYTSCPQPEAVHLGSYTDDLHCSKPLHMPVQLTSLASCVHVRLILCLGLLPSNCADRWLVCLSSCLSVCLSVCMPTCLFLCLCVCLSAGPACLICSYLQILIKGHISKAADVYAFAMVLWELYTAQKVFKGIPRALLGHQVTQLNRCEWAPHRS
jgi:hypothetical protein